MKLNDKEIEVLRTSIKKTNIVDKHIMGQHEGFTVETLINILNQFPKDSFVDITCEGECYNVNLYVTIEEPKTEKEINEELKKLIKIKEGELKQKAKKEERDRATYEKLKKRFEDQTS